MTTRSLFQRVCAVLGLIVISAYLFYVGKGHTLLLDTNAVTIEGKELLSLASVTVSVDGKELEVPLARAERDIITVSGPKHKIVITDDSDITKKIEKTITIPTFMNMAIVSIPAILGDAPARYWVVVFTPAPVEDTPVELMYYQED